ncbi:Hypothetical Protein XCAW_00880 [Xanthomonas citri subsp. citri Aw12879]|nr:Hypothetical Protein XCAW_00880 [Xanthomonas citri subsp. citri Aw12879]
MTQLGHLFRASPALRSAIIPGLALALNACTAGESAPHAVPTSAPLAPAKNNASAALQVNARLAALIQATGVTCTDATTAKGSQLALSTVVISTMWSFRPIAAMRDFSPA